MMYHIVDMYDIIYYDGQPSLDSESYLISSPLCGMNSYHDISYIIYYAQKKKNISYIILWRAAITREMTQRVVWSRLLCVGRTRSPPFFLFTSLPPKKVEGGSFFSHYEQVPMCVLAVVLSVPGVEQIGSLTKYAFVSQNRVWLYGRG